MDFTKLLGDVEVAPIEKRDAHVETIDVTIKGFTYDEQNDTLTAHLKEQNVVPYITEEEDKDGNVKRVLHKGSSVRISGRISEFTGVIPGATKQEIGSLTNVPATLTVSVFDGEIKKYLTPEINESHINRVISIRKLNSIGKEADLTF